MKKITLIFLLFLFSFVFVFSIVHSGKASQYVPAEYEYHHIYPQQFRSEFEKMGINIDKYTIKILKKYHKNHKAINKSWEEFFAKHKNPTKAEVEEFAKAMLKKYNFGGEKDIGKIPFYNYLTRTKTGEFIDMAPSFFTKILDFFGEFKGAINDISVAIGIFFAWDTISSIFTWIGGGIVSAWTAIWGAMLAVGGGIVDFFVSVGAIIIGFFAMILGSRLGLIGFIIGIIL